MAELKEREMGLASEFVATFDGLDDVTARWLRNKGVPETALYMWPGPIGVAKIEIYALGMFAFADHGRTAFVQPVLSGPAFSDLIDLVAWCPNNPAKWWSRRFTGVPLGADQLDYAEIEQKPLMLRTTPLSWLRANGVGVCVLDWRMSEPALRSIPAIVCEEPEHGRQMADRFRQPRQRIPSIRILKKEAA